jgi:hypothetical protein
LLVSTTQAIGQLRRGANQAAERVAGKHDRQRGWQWELWGLRAVLVAVAVYHLVTGNGKGAFTAGEGFVLSLLPVLIERFGHTRVPRAAALPYVLAITIQFASESFKLYEIYYYWDKFVHPAEVFLATFAFAFLLLGYIDTYELRMARPFAGAITMLLGGSLGAFWEFIEFTTDLFQNTDLQKSNADTMTDIFSNDVGAFLATLLGFWLYHRYTRDHLRTELGQLTRWLTHGPGKLLQKHGRTVGIVTVLLVAAFLLAAWFVDRNPPALPEGMAPGQPQAWSFTNASGGPGPFTAGAALPIGGQAAKVLSGAWEINERGVCSVHPNQPRPGSEKPALIALAPDAAYGTSGAFAATARYYLERPPWYEGTQMTAGIAFGLRDPSDFYVLEASTLHDFTRLDRFLHGRRRDVREKRVRTRAHEWHEVSVRVTGERVAALLDGKPIFEQTRVKDTAGGLGLWARATDTACFSDVRVEPL